MEQEEILNHQSDDGNREFDDNEQGIRRDAAHRFDYALRFNEDRENYENQARLVDYGTNWFPICGVGAVCFPEQQLPMKFNDDEREIYDRLVESARANGFVVLFPLNIEECNALPYIATLSKVIQSNPHTLSMELMGVNRCKVISYNLERGEAQIQLLPEIEVPSILSQYVPRCVKNSSIHEQRELAYRITGYPFHILRDITLNHVEECCRELDGMIGTDAVMAAKNRGLVYFSYFVAQQIFSNRKTEYSLLKESSANSRIAAALKYCKVSIGKCSNCNTPIFRNEHIMRLPEQTMTHVNAHGFVHKITLLSEVMNYDRASLPSYDFTWFPDYAWIIIQCSNCNQHIGWEYISMVREPPRFFGIQREGIRFRNGEEHENESSDESSDSQAVIEGVSEEDELSE